MGKAKSAKSRFDKIQRSHRPPGKVRDDVKASFLEHDIRIDNIKYTGARQLDFETNQALDVPEAENKAEMVDQERKDNQELHDQAENQVTLGLVDDQDATDIMHSQDLQYFGVGFNPYDTPTDDSDG